MSQHPQTIFDSVAFDDAQQALARVQAIYNAGVAHLRQGGNPSMTVQDAAGVPGALSKIALIDPP
mgnify:CR=1 FL=1